MCFCKEQLGSQPVVSDQSPIDDFAHLCFRQVEQALATRVRQLNAQVFESNGHESKNVDYKRGSCCG